MLDIRYQASAAVKAVTARTNTAPNTPRRQQQRNKMAQSRPTNRPAWMSEDAYAAAIQRIVRPPAPAQDAAPSMAPISTAAATRLVYIERFVDPPNPYLPAEERNELDVAYRELGARFGFARRVAVSPAGDVVCAFAELEAAERCVQALHGRRVKGRQLCADFLREDDDDGPLLDDAGAPTAPPHRPTTVRVGNAWAAGACADFVRRAADAVAVESSRFGPLRRAIGEAETCEVLVQFSSSLSARECTRELGGLSFDGRPLTCVLDEHEVAAAPEPPRFWQHDDRKSHPDRPKSHHRDRPPTPVPDRSRSRSRSPQGLVADYSSDDD